MTSPITIGQLAKATDTKAVTIRYYESVGLIAPATRTQAGYRLYTEQERDRLIFIKRARHLGLNLDDVKALLGLADDNNAPCEQVDSIIHEQLERVRSRLKDLQQLEQELDRLERCCQADTVADCKIIESLSR
ncbi:MerR family transcriptional regulator [Salinicola rhizosphaerae]|uniref:MerR family transcriptional regulator n=1 Tax=Salinicola rhizosphaerae TaxID=1443141 RepID=A0ABQ3E396_9GAMM|nr:helix-turn-helix domain-containing protein [Salinicola rhizosphaerae]GHB22325.1 MerR family transcriptional regulator [Salinicola rhizosphaerae]